MGILSYFTEDGYRRLRIAIGIITVIFGLLLMIGVFVESTLGSLLGGLAMIIAGVVIAFLSFISDSTHYTDRTALKKQEYRELAALQD